MYMLGEYVTFSLKNNIAFRVVNMPEFSLLIAGTIISLAGMGIGYALYLRKVKQV